uniref:cysteine-rich repeat secretory protein 38-like n=1 Tax=Erigeron canadensis TaxID=72917 RepID=UPI001CB8F3FD|nr:cysteine-rich repeat secretory protein 38-like [Erigeron canadensis]
MEKFALCTMLFTMAWFGYVESVNVGFGCSEEDNSTVNAVYRSNLRTLLDSLARNVPFQDGFFYNASVGNASDDRVYGLAWCRGDVSPDTCSECLSMTISVPLEDCPESKDLVLWYDTCSLRFKNMSFFGELWNSSSSAGYGNNNRLDDPSVFSKGFSMMESLARSVSIAPLMFDSRVIDVGKLDGKRYGMGQCSRDLSKLDCQNCLEGLLTTHKTFILNQTWWEMLSVSCGMWYDDDASFRNNNTWLTPGTDASAGPTTPGPDASGCGERWYNGEMMLAFIALFVMLY